MIPIPYNLIITVIVIMVLYYLFIERIKETQIYKSLKAAYDFSNMAKKPF